MITSMLVAVNTTTEAAMTDEGFVTAQELAVLFAQERARRRGEDPATAEPFAVTTIHMYVLRSKARWKNGKRGPYADDPLPMPSTRVRSMVWETRPGQTKAEREQELVDWYVRRFYPFADAGEQKRKR